MDDATRRRARSRKGVVPGSALGTQPDRAAERAGLVVVQPRAYVAATQPVDGAVQVEALRRSIRTPKWAVLGEGALWLYGVRACPSPENLVVGVPHSTRLRLVTPVAVSRVSDGVLARVRTRRGIPVVDLEMALIQAATGKRLPDVRAVLEPILRERRTTAARLRERCQRGLSGSASIRRGVDELAGGSLDAAVRRLERALEQRGVTGLECEIRFTSDAGANCYGDLWSAATRTLVEADGFLTHAVRERFRADRRRDRWMKREHEVTTLRVDVTEVWESLDDLADELGPMLVAAPEDGVVAG
jgi:hypothetical protein